jgi:Protein of unknown function (DUF3073)
MSAGYAESGSARWDLRRHQGRKAGTVVPVRMLVNVVLPAAGWRRRRVTHESQRGGDHGAERLRTFEGVEPMGRGRAKAKQVKVARQLKYKSDDTDLDRLRAELGVGADSRDGNSDSAGDYDDEDDDEDPRSDPAEDAWKDAEDAWPR